MQCFFNNFNTCVCLFLSVCLLNTLVVTETVENECQLPGGARGECVVLTACLQYVSLLKEGTTTELGLSVTHERRCGLEGNNLKVCCPTITELPKPDTRTNTNDPDFVDALPQPGLCAKQSGDSAPYVWNGQPVKTYHEFRSNDGGLHGSDTVASNYNIAGDIPVSVNKRSAHYSDGMSPDSMDPRLEVFGGEPVKNQDISTPPPFAVAGGKPLVRREMAQWMALLAYKRSPSMWECGGSIITKRHVLTAAHCIRDTLYVVRVGELDLAKTEKEFYPIDFYIKKKIPHEKYTKYHNDIAILVLDGIIPIDDPYSSKYIAPVCLPEPGFPYEKEGPLSTFITGWGETEKNGERPTNLLYAFLDILDQATCRSVYTSEALTIDDRVFCAGDPGNGRDACNGDSGGPLIGKYYLPDYGLHYYQIGLISYGYRCSAQRFTGVYTNITHFMPWILEKVTGKTEPRQWTVTTRGPNIGIEIN